MAHPKTTPKRTQSRPPLQGTAEFARYSHIRDRRSRAYLLGFAFRHLLIKVLPAGPHGALEKIRGMRAAPQEYAEELGNFSSEPTILSGVLSQAERALGAHIQRVETSIPKRAVEELYRARRERYPSCYA